MLYDGIKKFENKLLYKDVIYMIKKKFKKKIKVKKFSNWDDLYNAGENLLKAMELIAEQLNEKYNKRVKFNLELMLERAVDQFYESYTPNMYSRQEGLYDAGKITANDSEWSIDTDDGYNYMSGSYDAGAEYVFVNSFLKGYHGGAIDGPEHPNPGQPWWKIYDEWYKPATRGPSPEKLLEAQNPDEYIQQQTDEYVDESLKKMQPYVDEFIEQINIFYGNGR